MPFQNLCPPALIYLIFSITQVVIDTVKGLYNTALVKVWVAFIFTILLNYLCQIGLGIISWFIVFIPFLLMTLVVAILLLMFGLDPRTGKLKVLNKHKHKDDHRHHKHGKYSRGLHGHHPPAAAKDKVIGETDPVMKDYDSADTGGGGGGGGVPTKEETKGEKTQRILSKSLLFYSEDESENPVTTVKDDKKHLDTKKYELKIDTIANILSGMGENQIASDLQVKTQACINSAKKMDRQAAIASIDNCTKDIFLAMLNTMPREKVMNLLRNLNDTFCKDGESQVDCDTREKKETWEE